MRGTKSGAKCSQLRREGSPQNVHAEHGGYAGAHIPARIPETDSTNANESRNDLLEKIVSRDNMNEAFKRVKTNKGSHGIDGMGVDELLQYLRENGETIKQSILDGAYRPNPVRRVEIPKENGKKRNLGIPTVVDRVIQQAISQVLTPIYEKQFSENSFGFRPRRSAHDAIRKSQGYIEEGYKYVVDMDLSKFSDINFQPRMAVKTVGLGKSFEMLTQSQYLEKFRYVPVRMP
jgi:RNA-directed DNA polymerase